MPDCIDTSWSRRMPGARQVGVAAEYLVLAQAAASRGALCAVESHDNGAYTATLHIRNHLGDNEATKDTFLAIGQFELVSVQRALTNGAKTQASLGQKPPLPRRTHSRSGRERSVWTGRTVPKSTRRWRPRAPARPRRRGARSGSSGASRRRRRRTPPEAGRRRAPTARRRFHLSTTTRRSASPAPERRPPRHPGARPSRPRTRRRGPGRRRAPERRPHQGTVQWRPLACVQINQ